MIGGLFAWLRGSKIAQVVLIGLVIVAILFALIHWVDRAQDRAVEQGRQAGAEAQRADSNQEIITRAQEANHARQEIRDNVGSARYDECLRSAGSTAENCKRFLPQ